MSFNICFLLQVGDADFIIQEDPLEEEGPAAYEDGQVTSLRFCPSRITY
jgi:hypothetical protein